MNVICHFFLRLSMWAFTKNPGHCVFLFNRPVERNHSSEISIILKIFYLAFWYFSRRANRSNCCWNVKNDLMEVLTLSHFTRKSDILPSLSSVKTFGITFCPGMMSGAISWMCNLNKSLAEPAFPHFDKNWKKKFCKECLKYKLMAKM